RPFGLSYALSRDRFCSTSAGSGRSTTIASIVAFKSFCSTVFAPAMTTPSGPPSPSVNRLFLVPFFPRSVGFLPVFFPPKPGLAQHRIGTLPLPLHPADLVAFLDQDRPGLLQDPALDPPPEPVMDGALGSVPLGQPLPLAATPHPEEDRVEHLPPLGDAASGGLLRPELLQDWLDPQPQLVGDLPDRAQRLTTDVSATHGRGSSCGMWRQPGSI